MLGRFIFSISPYWNIKMNYSRRGFIRLSGPRSVYDDTFLHYFQKTYTFIFSLTIKHISGVLWPFPPRRSTQYVPCVVLMCLHRWAELAAEHSSVRRCAVMCCRCQIFPPSPSCYQLIYVTVQGLSCAKMETVGSCTRTHTHVILNRPKHNVMSSRPLGQYAWFAYCDAAPLLTGWFLHVVSPCFDDAAAPLSSCWKSNVRPPSGKKKCSDTHIFPGDKSNKSKTTRRQTLTNFL